MIYYDLMQDETIYDVEPLSFLMYIYLLGSTVYLYLIGHLIRTEYFTETTGQMNMGPPRPGTGHPNWEVM